MASSFGFNCYLVLLAFALSLALCVQGGSRKSISCEQLDETTCAFAVSSWGKRCILEKRVKMRSGEESYSCSTSEIEADEKLKGLVESDDCVNTCGLDRKTLGISSDSLLDSRFTNNLCAPNCYHACPNIVDLYFNLAAAEGVYLPKLCEEQARNPRREMYGIQSSGIAAPGPIKAVKYLVAGPTMAPHVEYVEGADAPAPY